MKYKRLFTKKNTKPYLKPGNFKKAIDKEIKKKIKQAERAEEEHKHFIGGFVPTDVFSGTLQEQNLLLIGPGTAEGQRVGDEITVKNIKVLITLFGPLATASNQKMREDIRVIVFQYKNQSTAGSTPNISEIFSSNSAGYPVTARNAYSQRNPDYLDTYHFLYDKIFTVNESDNVNATVTANNGRVVRFNVPLKYAVKKIKYVTTSTSNMMNGIWIAFIGSTASAATNAQMGCSYDVTYTDS